MAAVGPIFSSFAKTTDFHGAHGTLLSHSYRILVTVLFSRSAQEVDDTHFLDICLYAMKSRPLIVHVQHLDPSTQLLGHLICLWAY